MSDNLDEIFIFLNNLPFRWLIPEDPHQLAIDTFLKKFMCQFWAPIS